MDEVETDKDYFTRRAAEELAKALDALDPALAAKHRQLSSIYTSRALHAERKADLKNRQGETADDATV